MKEKRKKRKEKTVDKLYFPSNLYSSVKSNLEYDTDNTRRFEEDESNVMSRWK